MSHQESDTPPPPTTTRNKQRKKIAIILKLCMNKTDTKMYNLTHPHEDYSEKNGLIDEVYHYYFY